LQDRIHAFARRVAVERGRCGRAPNTISRVCEERR
jgi:hypothetical protein